MGPVGGALRSSARTRWNSGARGIRPARGQSLVEFALVLPLFLLLIFAVVEYSLINSAIGSYNFAAKDAARYGAIVGPTVTGTSGYQSDTDMLNIIASHVVGVVAAIPVEVDIFEATESGTFPGTGKEDQYFYNNGVWTAGTLTWAPAIRNDALVSQDYLGVQITYNYTYVTAFFSSLGATITLNSLSVQRIEPQEIYRHLSPGAEPVIAALDPLGPLAPALGLVAFLPVGASKARRARAIGRTNGEERWL